MKKITRCALAIGIIFSSCQKEANFARNWGQPVDMSDPTGVCVGGSVSWYPGISDEECISKIKTFDSYDPNKPLFLDPSVYDLNQTEEDEVQAPNPDYLGFPHHISSMSDKWGWDYYHEMKQLKSELGAEGMQIFLDKYCQGDSTLGMKLNKNF
tara:strand:+ start:370 stop:831 length:462 start_codon:yes stop_codon:yes gene_type:complete